MAHANAGARRAARVLFVALYPRSQAGTRLRAEAWCPELTAAGLRPEVWSFFNTADSEEWFGRPGRTRRVLLLARSALRAVLLYLRLPRYDVVVVLREVVPLASSAFERRIAKRSRLVWDVDDAIWTPYPRMFLKRLPEGLRRSERKYTRVATMATAVWAGSDEIADWCRQHSNAVWVLPTVPELPDDPPSLSTRRGAVWVGSHSTTDFLAEVLPALAAADVSVPVTAVGADTLDDDSVTALPWSEVTEDGALRAARAGLYPLDLDHPLAPARAGFKAALYMAYGLPSVVTPVPAVGRLVRDGVEGLHASTSDEWRTAVTTLLTDDELWQRMSAAARLRSERDYCTAVWAPRVADQLRRLLQLRS